MSFKPDTDVDSLLPVQFVHTNGTPYCRLPHYLSESLSHPLKSLSLSTSLSMVLKLQLIPSDKSESTSFKCEGSITAYVEWNNNQTSSASRSLSHVELHYNNSQLNLLSGLLHSSNTLVHITSLSNIIQAADITIQPLTSLDWDIMSTKINLIENQFLRHYNVVHLNQELSMSLSPSIKFQCIVTDIVSNTTGERFSWTKYDSDVPTSSSPAVEAVETDTVVAKLTIETALIINPVPKIKTTSTGSYNGCNSNNTANNEPSSSPLSLSITCLRVLPDIFRHVATSFDLNIDKCRHQTTVVDNENNNDNSIEKSDGATPSADEVINKTKSSKIDDDVFMQLLAQYETDNSNVGPSGINNNNNNNNSKSISHNDMNHEINIDDDDLDVCIIHSSCITDTMRQQAFTLLKNSSSYKPSNTKNKHSHRGNPLKSSQHMGDKHSAINNSDSNNSVNSSYRSSSDNVNGVVYIGWLDNPIYTNKSTTTAADADINTVVTTLSSDKSNAEHSSTTINTATNTNATTSNYKGGSDESVPTGMVVRILITDSIRYGSISIPSAIKQYLNIHDYQSVTISLLSAVTAAVQNIHKPSSSSLAQVTPPMLLCSMNNIKRIVFHPVEWMIDDNGYNGDSKGTSETPVSTGISGGDKKEYQQQQQQQQQQLALSSLLNRLQAEGSTPLPLSQGCLISLPFYNICDNSKDVDYNGVDGNHTDNNSSININSSNGAIVMRDYIVQLFFRHKNTFNIGHKRVVVLLTPQVFLSMLPSSSSSSSSPSSHSSFVSMQIASESLRLKKQQSSLQLPPQSSPSLTSTSLMQSAVNSLLTNIIGQNQVLYELFCIMFPVLLPCAVSYRIFKNQVISSNKSDTVSHIDTTTSTVAETSTLIALSAASILQSRTSLSISLSSTTTSLLISGQTLTGKSSLLVEIARFFSHHPACICHVEYIDCSTLKITNSNNNSGSKKNDFQRTQDIIDYLTTVYNNAIKYCPSLICLDNLDLLCPVFNLDKLQNGSNVGGYPQQNNSSSLIALHLCRLMGRTVNIHPYGESKDCENRASDDSNSRSVIIDDDKRFKGASSSIENNGKYRNTIGNIGNNSYYNKLVSEFMQSSSDSCGSGAVFTIASAESWQFMNEILLSSSVADDEIGSGGFGYEIKTKKLTGTARVQLFLHTLCQLCDDSSNRDNESRVGGYNGNIMTDDRYDSNVNNSSATITSTPAIDIVSKDVQSLIESMTDGYRGGEIVVLAQRCYVTMLQRSFLLNDNNTKVASLQLTADGFIRTIQSFVTISTHHSSSNSSNNAASNIRSSNGGDTGKDSNSTGNNVSVSSALLTPWEAVSGYDKQKQQLYDIFIAPRLYTRIFKYSPIKLSRSVLLYGYTGCGKSHLAAAIAYESNLQLYTVRGPELLDKYIGASEKAIRQLFEQANNSGRSCLLFFDEFEALAPKRGRDNTGVTDRVVNQLLTLIDGVECTMTSSSSSSSSIGGGKKKTSISKGNSNSDAEDNSDDDEEDENEEDVGEVFILAATCRPDLIDSALLRPGRIDRHVFVDFPSVSERRNILMAYITQFNTIASQNENANRNIMDKSVVNGSNSIIEIASHSNISSSSDNNQVATVDVLSLEQVVDEIVHSTKMQAMTCADIKAIVTQCHLLVVQDILNSRISCSDADDAGNGRKDVKNIVKQSEDINSPIVAINNQNARKMTITAEYLLTAFQRVRPSLSDTDRTFFRQVYTKFQGLDSDDTTKNNLGDSNGKVAKSNNIQQKVENGTQSILIQLDSNGESNSCNISHNTNTSSDSKGNINTSDSYSEETGIPTNRTKLKTSMM